jgi:hypothetical protein
MEYLMTYGWAILVIAVVLGVLFQLGVFSSSSFSVRAPQGSCQVFRPNGPTTTKNMNLVGVCTGQPPQFVTQFSVQSNSQIQVAHSNVLVPNTITINSWFQWDGVRYAPATSKDWAAVVSKNTYYGDFAVLVKRASGFTDSTINVYLNSQMVVSWQNLNPDTGWHMLSVTYNGFAASIYLDGALKASNPYSNAIIGTSNALIIGASVTYVWGGSISNFQIYNASLSADEIQTMYASGMGSAPMKLQNLAGWWPLNGDAKDYSGNNNNGVQTAISFTSQYGK